MSKRGTRCSARQHRLIHKAVKERLYSGNDELDAESHQQQPHNTGNHVNAGLPKQANQPGAIRKMPQQHSAKSAIATENPTKWAMLW